MLMTTSFLLDIFVLILPSNGILDLFLFCFFLYSAFQYWTFLMALACISLLSLFVAMLPSKNIFYKCKCILFILTKFLP